MLAREDFAADRDSSPRDGWTKSQSVSAQNYNSIHRQNYNPSVALRWLLLLY